MLNIDEIKEASSTAMREANGKISSLSVSHLKEKFNDKTSVEIMNEIGERLRFLNIARDTRIYDDENPDYYISKLVYRTDEDKFYFEVNED